MEVIACHTTAPRLLRVVAGVIAASMSCAASAALITVGPDPDCDTSSLPAAMLIARLNGTDFDEIRVMQGTYTNVALSSSGISYSLTGGYNHCRLGAQPVARTSLVGNFYDSVFSITGATSAYHSVTLAHLNISNGGSSGNSSLEGGGIQARDLRLVVRDTTLLNNTAGQHGEGGGIHLQRSTGAVSGILELHRNVRITGNTARNGGGIAVENASLRIRPDGTEIFGNQARISGGGVAALSSDVTVGSYGEPEISSTASGLVIRDNVATQIGGGLYIDNGLLDLRETAFIDNVAAHGGGLYAESAQVQIGRDSMGMAVQCAGDRLCSRFEGNVAGFDCPRSNGYGGAIYLNDSRGFIRQTLFSFNCAGTGAVLTAFGSVAPQPAIDVEGIATRHNVSQYPYRSFQVAQGTPLRIRYSTLTGDFARQFTETGQTDRLVAPVEPTTPSPDRYIRTSILETTIPLGWSVGPSDCNRGGDWQWAGMFRDGLNGDFRLAATATAIDACSPGVAPTETTDIERKPRCTDSPAHPDHGGRCDIGAFEYDADPFGYGFGNGFE